jgi:hypothetical protein
MSPVYIVTKDRDYCGATFDELEALAIFDDFLNSGDYQDVSVLMVQSREIGSRVLRQASQRC